MSWPMGIAISPDGSTLLVALSLADRAAVINLRNGQARFVQTGSYPYGAAILSDGRTGLVSNEGPGTVSVIDLASAGKRFDLRVGEPLSHAEGIALDPAGRRAFVTLANRDRVAVIDTASTAVATTLSVARNEGLGESPVDLSVTPDGKRLLVADARGDDIAIIGLPASSSAPADAYRLLGRVPTADYPVAALVTPTRALPCGQPARARKVRHRPSRVRTCSKLVWVSANGLGSGPNTIPRDPRYLDNAERELGTVGIADFPSPARLTGLTASSDRQLRPSNAQAPPASTPVRPDGPIRHVFYFVRENRNYDQVLGDLRPGNGDPALAIFGQAITPNMHALARRFGTLDHVFADSQVSIDGHMWTSGAQASDFVERNNHPSNAGRNYPYDFVYSIAAPGNGFIFDQARRAGVNWMNFGEGISSLLPIPDKDRTPQGALDSVAKYARSDLGVPDGCYPADAYIGSDPITRQLTFDSSLPPGAPVTAESRFACWRAKFTLQLLTRSVPALTYLTTVDDHTQGTTPGTRTPKAMIASSDWALGEFVDAISHSSIWPQSAIFVVEDDSQEGLDHIDAHRMPAFVISPYSRPGAVVSTRYDQLSVLRTIELLTGIKPLGLGDALATPMYDAFQPTPNLAPYTQLVPHVDMAATNRASAPDAALSRSLDFNHPDQVPQRTLDAILWHAMRGASSRVPPIGPNAAP
jgi:DNA-binding beta-propeller fold protein YncE